MKLSKYEQSLEDMADEFLPTSKDEFERIKRIVDRYKKNAVLNIRINQGDLDSLKAKAKKYGLKYQTFISEILHRVAHS